VFRVQGLGVDLAEQRARRAQLAPPPPVPRLPPHEAPDRLLFRNVKRFRGGLVCKAHRLLYRSTLGLRVIKKKHREHVARRILCLLRPVVYLSLIGFTSCIVQSLGPVVPSFRALSGPLKFTVRRHKFNKDSLSPRARCAEDPALSVAPDGLRFRGGLVCKAHKLLYHSTA